MLCHQKTQRLVLNSVSPPAPKTMKNMENVSIGQYMSCTWCKKSFAPSTKIPISTPTPISILQAYGEVIQGATLWEVRNAREPSAPRYARQDALLWRTRTVEHAVSQCCQSCLHTMSIIFMPIVMPHMSLWSNGTTFSKLAK